MLDAPTTSARRLADDDVSPTVSVDVLEALLDPTPTPVPIVQAEELFARLSGQSQDPDRYVVEHEIRRGGMGAVLKVWDSTLSRHLAMKVVLPELLHRRPGANGALPSGLARFLEEAHVTAQLDHPGIVPVHQLGIGEDGRAYFTMQLVRGQDLRDVIHELARGAGEWTRTRVLGLLLKACDAVAYAHAKGVIHRDIKPSNIMVGRFGEVYVMDWGLARRVGSTGSDLSAVSSDDRLTSLRPAVDPELSPDSLRFTMDGEVVGTPSYMPPEQATSDPARLGPRSDVYALGAVLYHIVGLRMPYEESTESPRHCLMQLREGPPAPLRRLAPDVPADLESICEKAMARDAARRYASVQDLADDLRSYLEGRVVRAHEVGALAELRKWVKRNRAFALTTVAALVAVLVLAGLAVGSAAIARQERDAAVAAHDHAARQRELAQRRLYVSSIARADLALNEGRLDVAQEALWEAPEEGRNWEWSFLLGRAEGHVVTLPHAAPVRRASFGRRGANVLTVTDDGTVRVWDWRGRSLVRSFPATRGGDTPAAASPTESEVAIADGGALALWETERRDAPRLRIEAHAGPIAEIAYAPGGESVATAASDGTARIWSTATGERIAEILAEGRRPVTSLAFDARGRRLLVTSAGEPGGIRLEVFGVASRERLASYQSFDLAAAAAGAFLAGDDRVLLLGNDLKVWDPADPSTDSAVRILATEPVDSAHADPTGAGIVTASRWDRDTRIVDLASGAARKLVGHALPVTSAVYSPDGRWILTASEDGTARVWPSRPSGPAPMASMASENAGAPVARDVHPDGRRILGDVDGSTVVVWDEGGSERLRIPNAHASYIDRMELSANGEALLTVSWLDEELKVWSVADGHLLAVEHEAAEGSVSPDGRSLAVVSAGGGQVLREIGSGAARAIAPDAGLGRVTFKTPTFSPDGARVLVQLDPARLTLVDADTSAPIQAFDIGTTAALRATFSPDGERLAIAMASGEIGLWKVDGGERIATLRGHRQPRIGGLAFGPDGTRLVTASDDATIVWDASDGTKLLSIRAHAGNEVEAARFLADGRTFVQLDAGPKGPGQRVAVPPWKIDDLPGDPGTPWRARYDRWKLARAEREPGAITAGRE